MSSADPLDKAIIPLASVFVGWLLAQLTGIVRDRLRERKIRKCLIEELRDLLRELQRAKMTYARALQLVGLKGIGHGVPSRLNNHIFKNYYKDAVLSLNSDQRISFQMIDALVDAANDGIEEVGKLGVELHTKDTLGNSGGLTDKDGEIWASKIKTEYTNLACLEWQVRFHLENQRSPNLSPHTRHHEQYQQHRASVAREIEEIVTKSAEGLRREDFEGPGVHSKVRG
jgi:hypothetical protein